MKIEHGFYWGQVEDGLPNGQGFLTYKGWMRERSGFDVFVGNF